MSTKVGVGYSHRHDTHGAGMEAVERAKEQAGIDDPDFVIAFGSVAYDQQQLVTAMQKSANGAPLWGCSTGGIIAWNHWDESSFIVAAMVIKSDEIKLVNGLGEGIGSDARRVGRALGEAARARTGGEIKALFVAPDGFTINYEPLGAGIEEGLGGGSFVPILGGGASDRSFVTSYQYCNDRVVRDGVAWAALTGNTTVRWMTSHGCLPIGRERIVTRVEGNRIYEIDGKPAAAVLREYMEADRINDWPRAISIFCIAVEAPGASNNETNLLVRAMNGGIDERTGAIAITSSLPKGSKIWMARRDYEHMYKDVQRCGEGFQQCFQNVPPELVLHFECVGRGKLFLRDRQRAQLLGALQKNLPNPVPWLGFFGAFELGPNGPNNCVNAFTSVIAAIGGGESANTSAVNNVDATRERAIELHDPLEILQHENRRLAEEVKRMLQSERDLCHVQEQLDAQVKIYEKLYEAGQKFNATFQLDNILQVASDFVMYGMRFERCIVFIDRRTEVTPDVPGTLEVGAYSGYYDLDLLAKVRDFSLITTDPLVLRILSEGALVFCASSKPDKALAQLCERLGMDELVVVSIAGDARALAGLVIAGNSRRMFDHHTRVVPNGDYLVGLGNMTSQAAAAIQNAKLYSLQAEINRELRAKNEQLTNFAFSAAHTLRTDWLGVGYTVDEVLELVDEANGDPNTLDLEEITQLLRELRPRANTGIQTVDGLLTYAQLGSTLSLVPASVRALVQRVIEQTDSNLVQMADGFPDLVRPLDEKLMSLALVQVIENAILYGEGKPVEVTMVDGYLRIIDHGRGIPTESLEQIFGVFQRGAGTSTGAGMGLAIARQIAVRQGIEVWAESAGLGHGATFIFDLSGKETSARK